MKWNKVPSDPFGQLMDNLRSDKVGLSVEERYEGIVYAVDSMTKTNNAFWLQERDPHIYRTVVPISKLIDQLWPALNKTKTNGMFWIAGSDTISNISEFPTSLWGIAIRYSIDRVVREEGPKLPCDFSINNAFDYGLSIGNLLKNPEHSFVYDIFTTCESLSYYLRRYDDYFLKDMSELNDVLSRLEGACFHIIKNNNEFAQAFLTHTMCKAIYGPTYPFAKDKWDNVTTWLVKEFIVHRISSGHSKLEMKQLVKIYYTFMKSKKKKIDRIIAVVKLSNSSMHYDFEHKVLLSIMEEDPELKPHKKRVATLLKANTKAYQIRNTQERKMYPITGPLEVLGYNFDPKSFFSDKEEDHEDEE